MDKPVASLNELASMISRTLETNAEGRKRLLKLARAAHTEFHDTPLVERSLVLSPHVVDEKVAAAWCLAIVGTRGSNDDFGVSPFPKKASMLNQGAISAEVLKSYVEDELDESKRRKIWLFLQSLIPDTVQQDEPKDPSVTQSHPDVVLQQEILKSLVDNNLSTLIAVAADAPAHVRCSAIMNKMLDEDETRLHWSQSEWLHELKTLQHSFSKKTLQKTSELQDGAWARIMKYRNGCRNERLVSVETVDFFIGRKSL
ncbi:hypothetical protein EC9_51550 [Rosistilla ulvae]|uniref:Uncharacterized protein n=1 Tax=Rosistilla ulvae TaxID=1930277 RepID=A0A517M825_9BACT|nr:hypothetical protein [Rosistilla ulvae]QDS90937.1 hypothetical protein EC9_51550 [Rosistilla ulvae]